MICHIVSIFTSVIHEVLFSFQNYTETIVLNYITTNGYKIVRKDHFCCKCPEKLTDEEKFSELSEHVKISPLVYLLTETIKFKLILQI